MSIELAKAVVAVFEATRSPGWDLRSSFCRARSHVSIAGSSRRPKTLRLLILPGVAALWPLFAWRWLAGVSEPIERNPHRTKAGAQ